MGKKLSVFTPLKIKGAIIFNVRTFYVIIIISKLNFTLAKTYSTMVFIGRHCDFNRVCRPTNNSTTVDRL